MDETLPSLWSSVQPPASNGADIDKALEQILNSSGGEGGTTLTEEEEEAQKGSIHHLHVPLSEAFPPSPDTLLNEAPNQRQRALPPISSSKRNTPSTLHPSNLSSLPPLTSSPLSSPLHRPPSLSPLDKAELKLPASMQQSKATPAGSKKEEKNLSHLLQSKAKDDKYTKELPKELLTQLQLETNPNNEPPQPPLRPLPRPANEDISLNDEVLSELSEELSDISSYDDDDDQPLMRSDGLKTLENLNLVISDDDEEEGEGEDFNRMSETNYERRKKEMEEKFQTQRIKPGDVGFVYDKEVAFPEAKLESGWDSDDQDASDLEF